MLLRVERQWTGFDFPSLVAHHLHQILRNNSPLSTRLCKKMTNIIRESKTRILRGNAKPISSRFGTYLSISTQFFIDFFMQKRDIFHTKKPQHSMPEHILKRDAFSPCHERGKQKFP